MLVGYRAPACRSHNGETSSDVLEDGGVQELLAKHQTLLVAGEAGTGKTAFLTQVLVPAVRQLGYIPVLVTLSIYFDAREKGDDLSGFVREKIFGQWYPDTSDKQAFARELAEAIRDRRVVWLLDGYDELTLRERGLFNQELERLDRFVLTTRRIKPEIHRPSEVTLQLSRY